MKLHPSVIEKLVRIYSNYGGYREETKLKEELRKVDLSSYTQQTGNEDTFLVLTEDILRHQSQIKE